MLKTINRQRILGIRINDDFIDKFDDLCQELKVNRSELVRYCLAKFYAESTNDNSGLLRLKSQLF
jgi:metal-responsive CopG/Arc/MetJ family transcriptional regulator